MSIADDTNVEEQLAVGDLGLQILVRKNLQPSFAQATNAQIMELQAQLGALASTAESQTESGADLGAPRL